MAHHELSVVCFGVKEQIDGSMDHVVLEFDFNHFRLTKYVDSTKIYTANFAEIKSAQTDGTQILLSFTISSLPIGRFIPFNLNELEDLCGLFNTIIDHIQETIGTSETSFIKDSCTALQPLICLRRIVVTQKSFKRKGKAVRISKLMKKKPSIHQNSHSIGFIVLTNRNVLCFEDEKGVIPLYIYPADCVEIKCSSSDFTFTCCGDKGVFQPVEEGTDELILFKNACQYAKKIRTSECKELAAIVNEMQTLFEGTFDSEREDHVNMLRRLWDASNLGISDEDGSEIEFKIKDNRWKALGFQRDDPVSDLRATGLLGLQNLIYFAETHPGLFMAMARNQQQSSEMEYPFATAGINITYLMITLLGLRNPRSWYPTMETHPLLFYNPKAWEELYTIIFRLFDQKWNQMLVGYMGFQKVIERTKEDVGGLLKSKNPMGEDVPFIFEMLGILLNDLDSFKTDMHRKQEKATHIFKDEAAKEQPKEPEKEPEPKETQPIEIQKDESSTNLKDTIMASTPKSEETVNPTLSPGSSKETLNRACFQTLPTPNNTWKMSTPNANGKRRKPVMGEEKNS